MADVKHTPGPWKTTPRACNMIDIVHQNNEAGAITKSLCRVQARQSWVREAEANACLIAAAPDLLEALQYARRFLRPAQHDTAFIDAAIAKAIGGAARATEGSV